MGRRASGLVIAATLICCIGAISVVRAAVAEQYSKLRLEHDVFALPSSEQAAVMSLGYRAAIADLVYAHVLVSYGLHFEEKRKFEHLKQYLQLVMYFDPQFVQPYLYADALLTLQPVPPNQQDYADARELLLQGTRALPYEQRVWFVAGQFIGYVAPPHLQDREEKERWKLEGAQLLAKACELASESLTIPRHCIVAATRLNQAGQREALIQMLTRTLAVNDDEQVRELALGALRQWVGEAERERHVERTQSLTRLWHDDLPFISKDRLLLLGPTPTTALQCLGRGSPGDEADSAASEDDETCAGTWLAWARAFDRRQRARITAAGDDGSSGRQ